MKLRLIIIASAALLVGILLYLVILPGGEEAGANLNLVKLSEMSLEDQEKRLEATFSQDQLPEGQEADLLAWMFENRGNYADSLIRRNTQNVTNLPTFLSDAALLLVREQNAEAGIQALSLARELYPNNPDVLGTAGIVAYLGKRPVEARKFLEEAESWRQTRPIVKFYLGGILAESEGVADRTRGKSLLMRVVSSKDEELSSLAGLILLGNPTLPLIEEDVETIFSTLQGTNTFRPENPNLSAHTLRLIINRLVQYKPVEALQLADLLMQYSGSEISDRLGMIQLAQDLGQNEIARTNLDKLEGETGIPEGSVAAKRLERIMAVQLLTEENFEEGLEAFEKLVQEQAEEESLRNTFQTALNLDLPIETEKRLLKDFLKLPVRDTKNSLIVLGRLVSIDPLNQANWVAYARENLISRDPVTVSQWLQGIGEAKAVIEELAGRDSPLSADESIALTEAYLARGNAEEAGKILKQEGGKMDPTISAYLNCRKFVLEENFDEAFEYWKISHQLALNGDEFPLLKNLGFLALEMNQEMNALQALYTAFSGGLPFSREQAGKLLELTLQYGNLRQSLEIAEFLSKQYPEDRTYINNLAYFNFLAEEKIEESVSRMRELVEAYPDINQYRLTLALGLIKAGRTNEASRIVQSTNIDWNEAGTRGQMIYAIVLAASNQKVVAEGLIRNLNLEELIPEEKALLEAF